MDLGRKLLTAFVTLLMVVLAGGFAAAAFVRYSPGFDVDENSWNPRLSAGTAEALHARRQMENRLPVFYARYVVAALHGDFGRSQSLQTPVAGLLRERAPVTLRLVAWGTLGGMLAGGLLAWLAVWPRSRAWAAGAAMASGLLLAVPPAVLALAFFFAGAPLAWAVALTVIPRVFGTMRALLRDLQSSPELLAARARGLGATVIALRYVLGNAAPQLAGLTGVALVLAFGAAIPIEALCDVPGVGQLAWKAALARDLPLLCAMALIITLATGTVAAVGDLLAGVRERRVA
jgi:peptide/nickel transport system permease protein